VPLRKVSHWRSTPPAKRSRVIPFWVRFPGLPRNELFSVREVNICLICMFFS